MNSADLPPQQPLRPADHVRTCVLGSQVVLLDLRRSKYFAVGRDQWSRLIGEEVLTPLDQTASRATSADSQVYRLLGPMLQRGLPPKAARRWVGDVPLPLADRSWSEPLVGTPKAVGALRTWRLLLAAAWAASALRIHSLQHIAGTIARRTARLQHAQADKQPLLDEAVAAFHALRPLLFTSRDRCLLDSLALVHFLASEGIAAHWVIGVKSAPFGAHAWVQYGSLVLNDLHDNVRHYKPILVV